MTHSPSDRPRLVVSGDGTLGAVIEAARVVVVDVPHGAPLAEITAPSAAFEVGWLGTRLLILSRDEVHTTVHLIDPHGPETIAEIELQAAVALFGTVNTHALVIGAQTAAILTASDTHLAPYQFPARARPTVAGTAANQFVVAIPGGIEEWDPVARIPKRRLRLPRPTTITQLGGSERVVWMVTQQEPTRIDVLPLINRGQPKVHELPEPIAFAAGHPRSDLLAVVGESGRTYAIDLDGRARLRTLVFPHLDRVEAIALVHGTSTGVLAAQHGKPLSFAALEARDPTMRTTASRVEPLEPAAAAEGPVAPPEPVVAGPPRMKLPLSPLASSAPAAPSAPAPVEAAPLAAKTDDTKSGRTAKNLAARFAAVRERREAALAETSSASPVPTMTPPIPAEPPPGSVFGAGGAPGSVFGTGGAPGSVLGAQAGSTSGSGGAPAGSVFDAASAGAFATNPIAAMMQAATTFAKNLASSGGAQPANGGAPDIARGAPDIARGDARGDATRGAPDFAARGAPDIARAEARGDAVRSAPDIARGGATRGAPDFATRGTPNLARGDARGDAVRGAPDLARGGATRGAPDIATRGVPDIDSQVERDIASARAWRDDVVAWARAFFGQPDASTSAIPIAPPIDLLAARFALSSDVVPALVLLYGAHLLGQDGVAPADIAHVLDATADRCWDEALGRGELAAAHVVEHARSRVRLADIVLRVLDELPPLTGTLVGTPREVALLAPCTLVADDAIEAAAAHATRAGGAILVGTAEHAAAVTRFEAKALGVVAMIVTTLYDGDASPAIYIADDELEATRLGLPRL